MSSSTQIHPGLVAWQNETAGWLALGQVGTSNQVFRVEERSGVVCAWWRGRPSESENYLLVTPGCQANPFYLLGELAPVIEASPYTTTLRIVTGKTQQFWDEACRSFGFQMVDTTPLMACDLEEYQPTITMPIGITARAVRNEIEQRTALEIIQTVFSSPRNLTEFFAPYQTTRTYLAHWNGLAVSAATLWPFMGAAGIFSVSTLEAYRRRGLALALLHTILMDVRRQGYTLSTLRATDLLVPFYAHAGFRVVGRLAQYVRRPEPGH